MRWVQNGFGMVTKVLRISAHEVVSVTESTSPVRLQSLNLRKKVDLVNELSSTGCASGFVSLRSPVYTLGMIVHVQMIGRD